MGWVFSLIISAANPCRAGITSSPPSMVSDIWRILDKCEINECTNKSSTHINQMRVSVLRALHPPESQTRMSIAPGPTTSKADNSALYHPHLHHHSHHRPGSWHTPPVISIVYCHWNRTLMWGKGANSKCQVARALTSEPHLNAGRLRIQ